MNSKKTQLTPIPIDFVVEQGLKEKTEAKRRPYRMLITSWADHEQMSKEGEAIASQLNTGKGPEPLTNLQELPTSVALKFRKGEKAEQLVMIIREISNMVDNDSNWTWALVMKVMMDEGLLMTNIPNKFSGLISSMVPGKGIDAARKNGNYNVINDTRSWRNWISNPGDDWEEATNRTICEEIYEHFKPLFDK